MKLNKKHLNKYLEEHGYHSLDLRKKLSVYDLEYLTDYLNSLDDIAYADFLLTKFSKRPQSKTYGSYWIILKKAYGGGYMLDENDADKWLHDPTLEF